MQLSELPVTSRESVIISFINFNLNYIFTQKGSEATNTLANWESVDISLSNELLDLQILAKWPALLNLCHVIFFAWQILTGNVNSAYRKDIFILQLKVLKFLYLHQPVH